MCINRGGFQAISHTVDYEDQVMMVVVEGRRPQCWNCKQLGHFSESCPQKTTKNTTSPSSTAATTTTATIVTTSTATLTNPQKTETGGPHQQRRGVDPSKQEKGGNSPNKTVKTTKNSPTKLENTTTVITAAKVTALTSEKIKLPAPSNKKGKKKKKQHTSEEQPEEMDIITNLKRRRGSDDITGEGENKIKSNQLQSQLEIQPKTKPQRPAHFNPHTSTLNFPNIQKPPIPNTALPFTPQVVLPVSLRDERTNAIIIIIQKKNKVGLN